MDQEVLDDRDDDKKYTEVVDSLFVRSLCIVY